MAGYGEQLTIGQIPHVHARHPVTRDRTAVVEGSVRLSWSELSARTARVAHALQRVGVGRGSRVATVLSNRAEYVEIIYALAGLGAATVPVSYKFTAAEIGKALAHSSPVVVITDDSAIAAVDEAVRGLSERPLPRVLVVSDDGASYGWTPYESVLEDESDVPDYLDMREWDTFHLAFTGGTSGTPKMCEIPQRVARQGWYDITVELGNRRDDVTVVAGPFYHGLGFTWGLQQLMVGGTLVLLRNFDSHELLRTIEREGVSFIPMVPTMFEMLLSDPAWDEHDTSSVTRLMSAGAPLLTTTKESLLSRFAGAELYELYGSTESGFFSVLRPEDQLRKTRSAGVPFFGCDLAILDEDGAEVPQGEIGRIYKRGLLLGARYADDSAATEAQFHGEWMTSSDLGHVDEEGYLYVVGRAKDMIISGGVNIYPTEIENLLVSHPDVAEAAVIGVPDDVWGEVVTACVVMKPERELSPAELRAHCEQHLARFKVPRTYIEFGALPKNAAGKLLKRHLPDLLR